MLFKNNKKKNSEEEIKALPNNELTLTEETAVTEFELSEKEQNPISNDKFSELATLLGKNSDTVKDECYVYQIRNFLSRVGKVIVRYDVSGKEFSKIEENAAILNLGEIVLAPAYLSSLKREIKTSEYPKNRIRAIIDFPFGESSFKNKIVAVKECVRSGVKGFYVTMPVLLLEDAKGKEFKKQVKKLGKLAKSVDIAISAQELTEEKIKSVVKAVEKSKVDGVTLVFGDASENEITEKIAYIKKYKRTKTLKILGNVLSEKGLTALFNLGVDGVLTPYADEIGKDLFKDFNIKTVNLY